MNLARLYGAKLAALDVSKLPQGVTQPSPFDAEWKTPSGHTIKHPVRGQVVDHGAATNPAYYDELSREIGKRNDAVEEQAPHDIAEDVSMRRAGNTFAGGALGSLTGASLGAATGAGVGLLSRALRGGFNSPGGNHGIGALAAAGGLIGGGLGGIGGAVHGAHKYVKPLSHLTYGDDEDGSSIPGGTIKHLYQESPEERRMKAMQEQMEATRSAMEDMHDDVYGSRDPYSRRGYGYGRYGYGYGRYGY